MPRLQVSAVTIDAPDQSASGPSAPRFDVAQLAAAHISPVTGLATDYLNHFNEAIMLLEMAGDCPHFRDDLHAWQPMSYREHFRQSRLASRDLAIQAYDAADPAIRDTLEALAGTMTTLIEHSRTSLASAPNERALAATAERAAIWLKLLVAQAGAIINGQRLVSADGTPQSTVDRVIG